MKSISIQISDERWLALQTKSEILQLSPEELLSRAIERVVHTPKKLQTPYPPTRRVFIDTNVLAQIVGNKSDGKLVIQCLQESGIEAVTFSKCVYELYSMIKGTTKDGKTPKSDGHPLKRFTKGDINDIGQRLFKKTNLTEKAKPPTGLIYAKNGCGRISLIPMKIFLRNTVISLIKLIKKKSRKRYLSKRIFVSGKHL
jgi:hypothetical protein